MPTRRMVLASAVAVLAIVLPVAAMQADRKVYKVGSGVTPPRVLYKEEPKYTQEASDAKIEGTVLLSVIIDVDGKAHEVEVKRSLEPGLDAAAIAALEKWIFRSGEKDGKPVAVSAMVEINFRLK